MFRPNVEDPNKKKQPINPLRPIKSEVFFFFFFYLNLLNFNFFYYKGTQNESNSREILHSFRGFVELLR